MKTFIRIVSGKNGAEVEANIEIAPCELVTYSTNYKCVAKSKETFNDSEVE